MTSFIFHDLFESPISKDSHSAGVKTSTYELGERGTIQPTNRGFPEGWDLGTNLKCE